MTLASGCGLIHVRPGGSGLKYLFTFRGRAGRDEFWQINAGLGALVMIVLLVTILGVWSVASIFGASDLTKLFVTAIVFVPLWSPFWVASCAVWVRRAHDLGMSGWWVAVQRLCFLGAITAFLLNLNMGALTPLAAVGTTMLLVVMALGFWLQLREGSVEPNRYGEATPSRVWPPAKAEPLSALQPRNVDEELKSARGETDEMKRRLGM